MPADGPNTPGPVQLGLCVPRLSSEVRHVLGKAQENSFDVIGVPVADEDSHGDLKCAAREAYTFTPAAGSDRSLDSRRWASVIGFVSPWTAGSSAPTDRQGSCSADGADSDAMAAAADWGRPAARRRQAALRAQLEWVFHCGMGAAVVPLPRGMAQTGGASAAEGMDFARILSQILGAPSSCGQLWLRTPVTMRPEGCVSGAEALDGWELWNAVRTSSGASTRLGVALEFTPELPSDLRLLDRWLAEPVKAVLLPTQIFVKNAGGWPVLPKAHKRLLLALLRGGQPTVLFLPPADSPSATHSSLCEAAAGPANYVARMYEGLVGLSKCEKFERPYWDYLQIPLQPLQENLESQTYETFEKDPVKYVKYEEALVECLVDRAPTAEVVIMVVGAGRGPLVQTCINALRRASTENFSLYAIEKNANAVITLRERIQKDPDSMWRVVKLAAEDMRYWEAPERADVVVSELLGSFGDNELSPECLDGTQRLMKPDAVSIPCRYWSSLEPVSAPCLWAEVRNYSRSQREGLADKAFETPYVVKLHTAFFPAIERARPCFAFEHPSPDVLDSNEHNRRYKELAFTASVSCLVHGFAGYFHCDLYKGIGYSIHPPTSSDGMFSWFPIFFPLKNAIYLEAGDVLRCHFWRENDARRVWYEWAVSSPRPQEIHNSGGRHFQLGK